MSIAQISVFSESKPGHLSRVLAHFEEAGVSVRGYSLGDTGEYGIVRFIVDKPETALDALKQAGFACTMSQVICLRLADVPGELARVVGILADCGINIIYSYSMIYTYIVISVSDLQAAEELLASKPVDLGAPDELASLR